MSLNQRVGPARLTRRLALEAEATEAERANMLALSAVKLVRQAQLADDARLATCAARCAVALAQQGGDESTELESLVVLGYSEWARGDRVEQAYAHAHEVLTRLGEAGCAGLKLEALNLCAAILGEARDFDRSANICLSIVQAGRHAPGYLQRGAVVAALLNLGQNLRLSGLHQEAEAAWSEGLVLAAAFDGLAPMAGLIRNSIALSLAANIGEHAAADDANPARARLAVAAQAMPPLDLSAWRDFQMTDAVSLRPRAVVQIALGATADARRTTAVCPRIARHKQITRHFVEAHRAAMQVHEHQGRWQAAIRYARRVLGVRAGTGDSPGVIEALQGLSRWHAHLGEFTLALAYRKELAGIEARRDAKSAGLRCRLAAIERRTEQRLAEARESLGHARRLSVIGRLIAQTRHALSLPLDSVRGLCERALRTLDGEQSACGLVDALAQVVEQVERAGGLMQQLKLFSFRSTPQPMALLLHRAVEQARDGLGPHVPSDGAVGVLFTGDLRAEVWADPQRLGILLKVLLIEIVAGVDRRSLGRGSNGHGPGRGARGGFGRRSWQHRCGAVRGDRTRNEWRIARTARRKRALELPPRPAQRQWHECWRLMDDCP
jgi:tetratricopeptide (TPR) repeat protein